MKRYILPVILLMFAAYSSVTISNVLTTKNMARSDHLTLLAQQFSQGSVALSPMGLPDGDYVDYFGKQYLYFGPLPSVLLVPLAAVYGRAAPQIILGFFSLALSLIAIFIIAKRQKFEIVDCLWLAIFFVFSTPLFALGTINFSAYLVQAVGVVPVLFAIAEYYGKRRWWLIGILIALAGLTRLTLYLSTIFFALEWLKTKNITKLLLFCLPILISLLVLGTYNYKRFHNPLESGYRYNITLNDYPMNINLNKGFFSVAHVPANLYALFLKSPEAIVEKGGGFNLKYPFLKADPWGMAIWFTSPLLLLLFRLKKIENKAVILTIIVLILPSLLYFGIGYSQFGYRYSLDFMPFVLLLLLPILRPKLDLIAKTLIIIGVVFNCIYMASMWGIYLLL